MAKFELIQGGLADVNLNTADPRFMRRAIWPSTPELFYLTPERATEEVERQAAELMSGDGLIQEQPIHHEHEQEGAI